MKKTITTILTSQPLCAESFNGKGTRSIIEACSKTADTIAKMVAALDPKIKVEFVNQIDEETPCNMDRFLFYIRISKPE